MIYIMIFGTDIRITCAQALSYRCKRPTTIDIIILITNLTEAWRKRQKWMIWCWVHISGAFDSKRGSSAENGRDVLFWFDGWRADLWSRLCSQTVLTSVSRAFSSAWRPKCCCRCTSCLQKCTVKYNIISKTLFTPTALVSLNLTFSYNKF